MIRPLTFNPRAATAVFDWRSYLPYALILVLLMALPQSGWFEDRFGDDAEIAWDLFAATISFAGLALRMVALTGTSTETHHYPHAIGLATTGVYSVVRHPLAVGNLIVLLGLALSVKVWWAVPLVLAVGGIFHIRRIVAEDKFLTTRYGGAYEAWRAITPAIVPDLSRWQPSTIGFSLRDAIHRDASAIYQIVLVLTLLEVGTDCIGEGEALSTILAHDVHWVWLFALATIGWAAMWQIDRPLRQRFWLLCVAVFIGIESIDRLCVLTWVALTGSGFGRELMAAVPLGAFADLAIGLLLGAPFLAGLYVAPRLLGRKAAAIAAHGLLILMLLVLAFSEIAELLFWNEFSSRFNSIAVSYLIFPREVIGNIRESFNLAQLLPLVAGAAIILYVALRRPLAHALRAELRPGERRRGLMGAVAALCAGLAGLWINPTDIFVDRAVNEATKNGFHSFLSAALTNDQQYDGVYLSMPEADARPIVRAMVEQDNTRFLSAENEPGLLRHVDNGVTPRKLHVVMILDESFGSTYVDDLDNTRAESISPRLSQIARDGLLFTNVYATGNRTVRALESVFTSFPPIPGVSTARRRGSEGMNSLPFLLKQNGYETAFLYGGRAVFDNMGYFWSSIGFDRVWDQSDIAEIGFTTAWGAADEYLYTEALRRMDGLAAGDKPAFLAMLTVSNHRPYTYPAGRIDKDPARKRRESAATYADWAFGQFIDQARGRAWFKDTVFIFMGDHGPRVYGAGQVPVPSYRVPLLFYAPAHISPERNPVLGSNMDVAPTLMGLLNISYDSPFFGIDLRRVPEGQGRIAMEHNFSVAVGDGENVAMILPGRASRGYAMKPGPHELEPLAEPDSATLRRTIALIQTAHHLFYRRQYRELGTAAGR